jgi:hypothetical protein
LKCSLRVVAEREVGRALQTSLNHDFANIYIYIYIYIFALSRLPKLV